MQSNGGHGGRKSPSWAHRIAAVGAMLAASAGGSALAAPKETVLYTFQGGADGAFPDAGLIRDFYGNLYSTTVEGGAVPGCGGPGCGVVFKLSPSGKETALYTFTGGADGAIPAAGLISDFYGNLYSTTFEGGQVTGCGGKGCGVVFKLSPSGKETVLHTFAGSDGSFPVAGLTFDRFDNLLGTTNEGGLGAAPGNGVVFKILPDGTYTVPHFFAGSPSDGANSAGTLLHHRGHLYGTTRGGGASGNGEVFEISRNGVETTLYDFTGGSDGAIPQANLIADRRGNLYGTAAAGGAVSAPACAANAGCGVVFKLSPPATAGGTWTETVLYTFQGGSDGSDPNAGLIADCKGNLFSTAIAGGAVSAPACSSGPGCGVVFKLSPSGNETVLYTFQGGSDGNFPEANLIADSSGNLYSTATFGGAVSAPACAGDNGCGVVFKLTRTGFRTGDEDECDDRGEGDDNSE